jgi:hypothetical protein
MRNFVLALCLAGAAATAVAADVSGKWKVDGDVYGNPVQMSCTFKQDGEKLSGTGTFTDGTNVTVTGSVADATVSFEFDTPDKTYRLVFTGKLDADGNLKGTIAVAGVEGTFTAVKQ